MVLSYGPLETIQNMSEPFFSKIKNERDIWGGHLKWDTLYNSYYLRNFDNHRYTIINFASRYNFYI